MHGFDHFSVLVITKKGEGLLNRWQVIRHICQAAFCFVGRHIVLGGETDLFILVLSMIYVKALQVGQPHTADGKLSLRDIDLPKAIL